MIVNGKNVPPCGDVALADFLKAQGYRAELVAVERNGEIVPRAEFGSTVLTDSDILEIVSFVGGG